MGCIVLVRCVLVLRCGLVGVVWYPDASKSTKILEYSESVLGVNRIQNMLPPTKPFGCSPSLSTLNLTTSFVLNTEVNTNKNFNRNRREVLHFD